MDTYVLFDPTATSPTQSLPGMFIIDQAFVDCTLIFINESYVNIFIVFPGGGKFFLPANDRRKFRLADGPMAQPGQQWSWYVQSKINPANTINQVLVEVYQPYEQSVENYPNPIIRQANVGNTIATSSVQTLSNEGGAANVLVIDIGDAAFSQLFTLFTDGHSVWAVDQAGVKHQVLKVQTSGNPLQLGQSGDISEVLGNLTVDGNAIITGTETVTGALTATASASSLVSKANTLADIANLPGGRLGVSAAGDVLDAASATNTYFKARTTGGTFHWQTPDGTTIAQLAASTPVGFAGAGAHFGADNINCTSVFMGNGAITGIQTGTVNVNAGTNVVVNHNLGNTPAAIMAICDVSGTNDSISASTYTSTQFTLSQIGGVNSNFRWMGYR